ncbi:hypothetical protein DPMN_094212 [Dreissena polymorpha]|uniref:Uncharacterized protein n=1 Tax=Dreissena polymorpha TaxID=45954 RepID=A0A9D4R2H4_DREPO|nr:hypothetical protein DPMN_094212 [Dreissena polymorpha]
MATVRQYDGDNAIERWRHCDDTTATVRYDYRIVAPCTSGNYKQAEAVVSADAPREEVKVRWDFNEIVYDSAAIICELLLVVM